MATSQTWRVVGTSVKGTSHLAGDVPCQDAHAYEIISTGEVIIAVADGAGSASRSQEGAQLAVTQVVAAAHAYLERDGHQLGDAPQWQQMMHDVFTHTRQKVLDLAAAEATSARSFATTLMCAVLTATTLVVGQLGDGMAVGELHDGTFVTLIQPQRGEYANETSFLTQADALERLAVVVYMDEIKSLVLSTDGLLRLALHLPDYTPSPRFFQPLLEFVAETADDGQAQREIEAFLESERVGKRTDDDKTLVIAIRLSSSETTETATELQEDT